MEFNQLVSLKEFAGVFTSLVCYSRIGIDNLLYSGGINLAMVLFVFGFPFLNPYLTTLMYLGPLWDQKNMYKTLASWLVSVCAQVGGACTAGTMHTRLKKMYGQEALNTTYTYISDLPASTCIADEMFAVLFVLVGLLHLMRALTNAILTRRFWDSDNKNAAALSIPLITCAVFLVVAITHAFPSANQSLHITIFLAVIEAQSSDVCAYRSLGGFLGTLLALTYYHLYYKDCWLDYIKQSDEPDNDGQIYNRSGS